MLPQARALAFTVHEELLPELRDHDQPAGPAGHGPLLGPRRRLQVERDVARGIEAALDRRGDHRLDPDLHDGLRPSAV
jgi:hypothetical protein